MVNISPILFREFIIVARKRQMWVLRFILPALAIGWVGPRLAAQTLTGGDWRGIAAVARPAFTLCAWMGVLIFPLLAFAYASTSMRAEWSSRVIELIATTPVSRTRIMPAKLLGVLGRIFVLALAMWPVMLIGVQLGHLPSGMGVGAAGVVVGQTVLWSGVGLLMAAAQRPTRRWPGLGMLLLAAYVLGGIPLAVWTRYPLLIALIPPWSFQYVISETAPAPKMAANAFLAMAVFLPLAIGLVAVLLSPVAFILNFNAHVAGNGVNGRRGALAGWRRLTRPGVRKLRPAGNPFYWQERRCSLHRAALWYVGLFLILTVTMYMVVSIPNAWMRTLNDPEFHGGCLAISVGCAMLVAGLFGSGAFLREKLRHTADVFMLTGCRPGPVYAGKLRALLLALWPSWVVLALCVTAYKWTGGENMRFLLPLAVACNLLATPLSCLIGLVFGAAAKNWPEVISSVVASPLYAFLFAGIMLAVTGMLGLFLQALGVILASILGPAVMVAYMFMNTRLWTIGRMCSLLGLTLFACVTVGQVVGYFVEALARETDPVHMGILHAGVVAMSLCVLAVLWYLAGVRSFEQCMLGENTEALHANDARTSRAKGPDL